jgi:hypothetical protein
MSSLRSRKGGFERTEYGPDSSGRLFIVSEFLVSHRCTSVSEYQVEDNVRARHLEDIGTTFVLIIERIEKLMQLGILLGLELALAMFEGTWNLELGGWRLGGWLVSRN